VVIADGLKGQDFVEIEVNGRHLERVKVASAAAHADALITVSHLTGHELTAFGGALKNIGMGLGSRGGKQQMHSDVKPEVSKETCTACGGCLRWCPAEAISLEGRGKERKAVIDPSKCIGCGECTVMCLEGAIAIRFASDPGVAQRKIVEYAAGVLQGKERKSVFFNFLLQVTPGCDCWDFSDTRVMEDIGILASRDIVAVEQASMDLVKEKAGRDLFGEMFPQANWSAQLDYAQEMGLGNRAYEFVAID
jgi:uncharacterized Fe-S center protein